MSANGNYSWNHIHWRSKLVITLLTVKMPVIKYWAQEPDGLDLLKSLVHCSPNCCPSGQPSPQVTELSLKEMLIPFSSSPAHLYLFGRAFDCKNELPPTLLWVLNKHTFLFVDHHLFHICMQIICGNPFHLNIHSWKGDNQIGLTRFETIIFFNNKDSEVIISFLSRF